jgi:hypothetical protein
MTGYGDLPETCDIARSYEPWPDYDSQNEDAILAKIEEKATPITEERDHGEIETAAGVMAAVVNHERQKAEPRQRVLDEAYGRYVAGMTAN